MDIGLDALIKGSPMCIITTIEISRAIMRDVRRNLVGAFGYNALGILVAMGVSYPFIGILLSPLRPGLQLGDGRH